MSTTTDFQSIVNQKIAERNAKQLALFNASPEIIELAKEIHAAIAANRTNKAAAKDFLVKSFTLRGMVAKAGWCCYLSDGWSLEKDIRNLQYIEDFTQFDRFRTLGEMFYFDADRRKLPLSFYPDDSWHHNDAFGKDGDLKTMNQIVAFVKELSGLSPNTNGSRSATIRDAKHRVSR